ncbi:MAG TPA: hypothetical protein VFF33_04100 [Ignavibacteriaceae bacterium]|nr:hypothetical protein [Ignavibacteriaceae bacterium]
MFIKLSTKKCSKKEFVEFWSSLYNYDYPELYNKSIIKKSFKNKDIENLFLWKNGMRLSFPKQIALKKKVLAKLSIINKLKRNFSLEKFNEEFQNLSAIWKIFLLHCIRPDIYPIFDQHVFRAMSYILSSGIIEISKYDKKKYEQYFKLYLPFFYELLEKDFSKINLDKSLWMFGRSLKEPLLKSSIKF